MGFVDTHVHLHFSEFDSDREAVIQRARDGGVEQFINVGTDLKTSQIALKIAQAYDFIWATAGFHPHETKHVTPEIWPQLEELLRDPKMVAIGEVGLDFFHDHSPQAIQIEVFEKFIDLHHQTRKPLVIHCRDAYEKMLEELQVKQKGPYQGVMHCFASDAVVMEGFIQLGFHISFAGPLTYKKNDALREACQQCPPDRLLIETDAPYLPPQSMRGKRNEPLFMTETAEVMARLHNLQPEALAEQIKKNVNRLFFNDGI